MDYLDKETRILSYNKIRASNGALSKAHGDESGRFVPQDATGEYIVRCTTEAEKNGEEEVIEEHNRGNDYIHVQRLNDNERNESDGGGDRGEVFTVQFSADSDVDDDAEVVDTDEEVDKQPLISAEIIERQQHQMHTRMQILLVVRRLTRKC